MHSIKSIIGGTYSSKLASREWKDYARSIRASRGNACECCRRTGVVTQVHHLFYDTNKEPWEALDEDVILLCVACHSSLHEELKNFRKFTFKYMTPQSFLIFNRALMVAMNEYEPLIFAHAFAEFVGNERLVNNHAKAFGLETARKDK